MGLVVFEEFADGVCAVVVTDDACLFDQGDIIVIL